MPIYEYRCAECGHTFEKLQQFSDPDPDRCPDCDGTDVGRLVSQSNFQLKGGGWYADDYGASPDSANEDEASPASTSDDDGGNEEAAAE